MSKMFVKSIVMFMLIYVSAVSCTSTRLYLYFLRILKDFWISVSVK